MDDRVRRELERMHARLDRFKETNATAARHAHYVGEALKLALRSLKKEPEKHRDAIEVVEREIQALQVLDEMFEAQEINREKILRPTQEKKLLLLNEIIRRMREKRGNEEFLSGIIRVLDI